MDPVQRYHARSLRACRQAASASTRCSRRFRAHPRPATEPRCQSSKPSQTEDRETHSPRICSAGDYSCRAHHLASPGPVSPRGTMDPPSKPSWILFARLLDSGGAKFVPPEERIATFDQDGTLWVEHPMYTQVMYCLERVPVLAEKKPELKKIEPFKTVLSGNRKAIAKLSMKDLEKILAATLTGMSVEEFRAEVKKWLATAKHPRFDRLYTELTYQPMQEVLQYLRASGLQDLHCHRRWSGLRSRLLRADLRYPAGTSRRHRGRNQVRLR